MRLLWRTKSNSKPSDTSARTDESPLAAAPVDEELLRCAGGAVVGCEE